MIDESLSVKEIPIKNESLQKQLQKEQHQNQPEKKKKLVAWER